MRLILLLTLAIMGLSACDPSEAELQDAVAEAISATQQAIPTATAEPTATATPRATNTPVPTNTPAPTNTKEPSPTPRPTLTPTPIPTVDPSLLANGGRCIDQITNDSYIFIQAPTKLLWARGSPTILGFVAESEGAYDLQIDFYYVGDAWLFIDELIFNVDGEVIRMTVPDLNTDVLYGGSILESGTISITSSKYDDFFKIITGEDVKLRYSGSDGIFDVAPDEFEMGTLQYAYLVYLGLQNGTISLDSFEEACPY